MITTNLIAFIVLSVVLLIAAITDCLYGKVYNKLTYPAILLGLALWTTAGLLGGDRGLSASLIGLACGLIPFAIIARLGGLGGGDVKLMAAVGAMGASWQVVLSTAFYAMIVAMVMAVVIMFHRGIVRQTLRRILGAALSAAARSKTDLNNTQHTVPFGAAVAVGGIIASAEQLMNLVTPWAALSP